VKSARLRLLARGETPPDESPDGSAGTPTRHDLRLAPLAGAGWAAAWCGTAGSPVGWIAAAVGAAVLLAVSGVRRSAWVLAIGLVIALLAAAGALHDYRLTHGPVAGLAQANAVVEVTLEVRADARLTPASAVRPGYATVPVRIRAVTGRGTTWRVWAPGLVVVSGDGAVAWTRLPVGTRLTSPARLQQPDRGSGLAAMIRINAEPTRVTGPNAPLRLVERVRDGLRTSVQGRSPEPRALVPALVLGDTSGLTAELKADFQSTGLTHLTAVSGANLTLLLAFVLTAARWAGVRGWWLRLMGLGGLFVFVALCRTEPSVLRAAAMGLVALAALGAGGRRAGVRNLALAMLLLLMLDPFLSRSVGFALSVLASGGIIWWARSWAAILHRRMPLIVAETITVPLAAHLVTVPVVAAISGQISASGLLANALAGPFVGPATVLGFAAAGSSLISRELAAVCGWGAAGCAQLIIWVAQVGAALPGSSWPWPTDLPRLVWLGAAALAAALVMGLVLARGWLCLLLAVIMSVGLMAPPWQPGWPPRDWVLLACPVGQGDGLVLRVADGVAIVVDAGPDPEAIDRCLDQLGVRTVPLLILTHFHADHVDGLAGVLERRSIGEIWVSPLPAPAHEVAIVHELAHRRRVRVIAPPVGTRSAVGPAQLEVLGPATYSVGAETESSAENDGSLVVMATVSGVRILLTGDVEPPGQAAILAGRPDLRADVLKVPHHGSARQDPAFFAATGSRVAIMSAGADNDYGHPAPRTVQLARSLGMTVLRTDQQGAVAITVRDGRIGAVSQRQ